jgi:hypothetical protein
MVLKQLVNVTEQLPNYTTNIRTKLPPFALAHARTLYRKLREYSQDLEIVLGLWGFSGDADKVAARIGLSKPATVCATLSEAVEKVRSDTETEPTLPTLESAPAVIGAGCR